MLDKFSASVRISSPSREVWKTLTDLKSMAKWLGEPEMNIEVQTNWETGSSISIRGFHHINFESKGTVLRYEKEKLLSFTHLSSLSRLPDKKENYSILEFILNGDEEETLLTLNIDNFRTETIRKHLEFYWRTTILSIKEQAENQT